MASWETKNRLAEFLVKNEAIALERAIPFGEAVKAGAVGRSNIYQIADKDLGFHSLYGADGKRAIWYDHDSLSEMCRFGEYYPKSIPIKPTVTVGPVAVECSHPTVKLPGSHILDSAKKGKPILVEWVRPAYHKDTMAAGVKRPETFDESLKEDLDDLLSYLKANVPDKATTTSARLLNKIAGIYGVLRGDELE